MSRTSDIRILIKYILFRYDYFRFFCIVLPVWRNWIARWTSNPKGAGSNPVMGIFLFLRSIMILLIDYAFPTGSLKGIEGTSLYPRGADPRTPT